jgi:hypothetical protein
VTLAVASKFKAQAYPILTAVWMSGVYTIPAFEIKVNKISQLASPMIYSRKLLRYEADAPLARYTTLQIFQIFLACQKLCCLDLQYAYNLISMR